MLIGLLKPRALSIISNAMLEARKLQDQPGRPKLEKASLYVEPKTSMEPIFTLFIFPQLTHHTPAPTELYKKFGLYIQNGRKLKSFYFLNFV